MRSVPGSRQCGGFAYCVGREQQAVRGKVCNMGVCSASQLSYVCCKLVLLKKWPQRHLHMAFLLILITIKPLSTQVSDA